MPGAMPEKLQLGEELVLEGERSKFAKAQGVAEGDTEDAGDAA